jgi:hypothetical protein
LSWGVTAGVGAFGRVWCLVTAVCDDPAATDTPRHAASPAMSSTGCRPVVAGFVVERVETVGMTDEQYEQAVNTLATLIVRWTTGHEHDSACPGQADSD